MLRDGTALIRRRGKGALISFATALQRPVNDPICLYSERAGRKWRARASPHREAARGRKSWLADIV